MTTTVELPSGNSAVLRDPKLVTRKLRLPIEVATIRYQRAMVKRMETEASGLTPSPDVAPVQGVASDEEIEAFVAIEVATILCMVESWTYPFSVDADGYDAIAAIDADVLSKAANDAKDETFFQAPVDPDPESPTQPSSD